MRHKLHNFIVAILAATALITAVIAVSHCVDDRRPRITPNPGIYQSCFEIVWITMSARNPSGVSICSRDELLSTTQTASALPRNTEMIVFPPELGPRVRLDDKDGALLAAALTPTGSTERDDLILYLVYNEGESHIVAIYFDGKWCWADSEGIPTPLSIEPMSLDLAIARVQRELRAREQADGPQEPTLDSHILKTF